MPCHNVIVHVIVSLIKLPSIVQCHDINIVPVMYGIGNGHQRDGGALASASAQHRVRGTITCAYRRADNDRLPTDLPMLQPYLITVLKFNVP